MDTQKTNPKLTQIIRDVASNPPLKLGYQLIFQDEFSSSTIDATKWIPHYLPQWSSRVKTQPEYHFSKSGLALKITPEQQPWSPEFNGAIKVSSLQTGVFSGKLGSAAGQHRFSPACRVREEQIPQQLFTPHYGYVEIRARSFLGATNVAALWMIGFEDEPHKSGEICIMEIKGSNISKDSFVNGWGIHPFGDPNLKDEFHEDSFALNPADWHIYAVDWQPEKVDFYLDSQLVRTIYQSPNYPMQLMLNIYQIPVEGVEEVYPQYLEVDYVRAYEKV